MLLFNSETLHEFTCIYLSITGVAAFATIGERAVVSMLINNYTVPKYFSLFTIQLSPLYLFYLPYKIIKISHMHNME
ncbi:MAG: hypothetical protein K0S18_963 [Anaerocolumna sp.]|jgi:hypothetical protein|nr:hypothetical protein [Anaerocolumna sp.]